MHAFARRRSLALAALALTLFTVAAAFVVRRALACPAVVIPQPLRALYRESDRIVVARVGHTELIERDDGSSRVRTALHVERNVKGKDEGPVVFVRHVTWTEEGVEKPGTYKEGERLLVFLEHSEEEDEEEEDGQEGQSESQKEEAGYVVDDATYGVKKLTDDELKVYLARIDELRQIVETETPDQTALVEWLVRCAEEKATRWEGAYELQLSADALESLKEQQEQPADEAAMVIDIDKHSATVEEYEAAVERARAAAADSSASEVEAAPQSADAGGGETDTSSTQPGEGEAEDDGSATPQLAEREPDERSKGVTPDPSFAEALSDGQKRRLADALFGAEKLDDAEDTLLQVVAWFGDPRLVPFLVSHLRRVEDDPSPQTETWLGVLSRVMASEEAAALVSKYMENVTYYEEEETADGGTAVEEELAGLDEEAAQKAMEAREAAGNERARKKRSAMLKDLLAGVERILASPPQLARQ